MFLNLNEHLVLKSYTITLHVTSYRNAFLPNTHPRWVLKSSQQNLPPHSLPKHLPYLPDLLHPAHLHNSAFVLDSQGQHSAATGGNTPIMLSRPSQHSYQLTTCVLFLAICSSSRDYSANFVPLHRKIILTGLKTKPMLPPPKRLIFQQNHSLHFQKPISYTYIYLLTPPLIYSLSNHCHSSTQLAGRRQFNPLQFSLSRTCFLH